MFSGKYDYTVYLFLIKTGERASEVAGSNWKDIDFDNRIIRVNNAKVLTKIFNEELEKEENKIEDSELKSEDSVRKIPMLFGVYELLMKYREEYMKVNKIKKLEELNDRPLFLTRKGNRVKADFLWTKLNRFLRKSEFRHIGVHQLRHTFATRCLESGVSLLYVKKLLGHSDIKTTQIYVHLVEEFENEEDKKIEQYYNNKLLDSKSKENKFYKGKIKGKLKILRKIA